MERLDVLYGMNWGGDGTMYNEAPAAHPKVE
jgi:hypothetical protein